MTDTEELKIIVKDPTGADCEYPYKEQLRVRLSDGTKKVYSVGGGTGRVVDEKDINFFDYEGTLLYSYTIAEANALTELPTLPEREGLICQGWKLKPTVGKTQVDDLQKYKVVVNSGLSEQEQLKALGSVLGEGLYKKVSIVCNNGVSPKKYLEFREILPQFDSNGSGSFSKAEVKAALDSFGQSGEDNPLLLLIGQTKYGEGLTNAEKAAIWQSYNKTWKPSQNPYDKTVGQRVYNWMQAQEEGEAESTSSQGAGGIGDEIMRQILEKYK